MMQNMFKENPSNVKVITHSGPVIGYNL
jgi:hypothetical protein